MKQVFGFLVKAAVSGLLLYLALKSVDFDALRDRLLRLEVSWSALAFAILVLQVFLLALRWRLIAEACGAALSDRKSSIFTFIGMFFNQTLPSTVGGDAARIWLLARTDGWKNATYSVLVDRAAGLIWLALIVLACLPWSLASIADPVGRITLMLIGAAGVIGPIVLFSIASLTRGLLKRWRLTRHALEMTDALRQALVSRRVGIPVSVLSLAIHMITVIVTWTLAKAIGAPLSLVQSLILVPPVTLISAVPISIAGWGVREGAMVAAFTYAGLSASDGLAVSVLFGVGLFAIGAVGGVLWLVNRES
jgi:uncharacterized protein (TIRG00374 family)